MLLFVCFICLWRYFKNGKTYISIYIAAAAKSRQLCPTLCDPIDGSPPGSLVPGILQARTLEWVAISFSNTSKWKVKMKLLICNPRDCSLQGSSVHGSFQAGVLEWGAIAFSTIYVQFSSVQSLSRVQLFSTPWIAAHQASLSITNSRSSLRLTSIMAPHSSTLAWKFSWMEEPGRLQSMGSLRVGHDWATSLSLSLDAAQYISGQLT